MDVVLKLLRSEVRYRGKYVENAFDLLAAPAPLYKSLLKQLGVFGANLQDLKVEAPTLADSHINCSLPDLGTSIRVRLDRLEIDCWRLKEIGTETAERILLGGWAAIHEADATLQLQNHMVDVNVLAEVQNGTAADVLNRYVRTPEALAPVDTGVAFYCRPIQKDEDLWFNVVLDRVFKEDRQLTIKMTVGCVEPLDRLASTVLSQIDRALNGLGLYFLGGDHFSRDEKK